MLLKYTTYLLIGILFIGCAGGGGRSSEPYYTRIYEGTYDEVWLATLRALGDYPLKISNKDIGRVRTETINGPYNELFMTHPEPLELPERYRFSMRLRFAKLAKEEEGTPLVRVRMIKDLEKYRDFYTGWLKFPSDGIEEKTLLYRIEHLLRMEKKLAQAQKK